MPNWKKVIISGSDAALNSLNVTTSVTASNISASGDIYTDTLIFNTGSDHSVGGGQVGWNTSDGTLNIGLEDGVMLQAGQELHIRAKAQGAISNGDAVMFAGAQGDHILVSTATQAVINANPEYFVGIATHNLSNNEFGYISTFGLVRELDTDTPAWDPGTVLWFDSEGVTAGALTSTQPSAPYAQIRVAAVTRRNPSQGVILVRPDRLPKLNDLQDVQHTTPDYGDLIMYNSSSEVWENTKTLSGSYTIDNGDLNVNGSITGSDVQIDDWGSVSASLAAATLTNPITGTGTTNYVSKFTGTNTLGDSLIFDNGTNVGIGTTNPTTKLHLDSNVNESVKLSISSTNSTRGGYIEAPSDDNGYQFKMGSFSGHPLVLITYGSEKMRITPDGDVGIGTTSPSTELHVVGSITLNDGNNNTKVGTDAGLNYTGFNQSAFGIHAGRDNTGTFQSTFGSFAGKNNTGNNQSAFGFTSGIDNTGNNQSAFGREAGKNNSGDSQSVYGFASGINNSGDNQSSFGYQSGQNNTGTDQSAFGKNAGLNNTGADQTVVGSGAGNSNIGDNQSAFGRTAGVNNSGSNQSAFGFDSGRDNEGNNQSAFGQTAGQDNTGNNQSAFGYIAGRNNTGANQSAVGVRAGQDNTGINQSAFGYQSGQSNTGFGQSAFGLNAGLSNTGARQSAFGYNAGNSNTGKNNSNFGYEAGYYLSDNITINTGSSDSVFLGANTKALGGNQANQIVIGYDATGIGANSVTLGNDNIETTALKGNVGIGTTSPDEKLHVEGDIKTTNALISNQENTDVDTGTETVAEISSTTYTAAFFDYVIKNDTNLRAGTVFACHDGSGNVEFTETSTNDLGDTSDVALKVDISGGNIRLTATTISDNWSVKSLVRGL